MQSLLQETLDLIDEAAKTWQSPAQQQHLPGLLLLGGGGAQAEGARGALASPAGGNGTVHGAGGGSAMLVDGLPGRA